MDANQLRRLQAPLKEKYRSDPESARVLLSARGAIQPEQLACQVPTSAGSVTAGLHAAAGGTGEEACSGDMLLQALVACSGVTFAAVATALAIPVVSAEVHASGELDFRGTLGVDRSTEVGLTWLKLQFVIDSPSSDAELDKLVQLTERYCVVLQTLARPPRLENGWSRS